MDNKNKRIKTIMKKTNIKILFLSFVLLSVFGLAVTAQAAGDSIYVSPATSTVNAGGNITASVVAGTSGDKICAVQGTIVFNNMTCQSITVTNGLLVQNSPTCSNPSFVLAIPKCATTDTTLFTVSSTAGNAGTASISFSGVKLAGVGVVVGTASTAGNYTVNSSPVAQPKPTTTKKTTTTPTTSTTVTTPTTNPAQQTTQVTNQPAAVTGQQASLATTSPNRTVTIILIIVLIILVIGGLWYMISRDFQISRNCNIIIKDDKLFIPLFSVFNFCIYPSFYLDVFLL
jgi:hypothetical protein